MKNHFHKFSWEKLWYLSSQCTVSRLPLGTASPRIQSGFTPLRGSTGDPNASPSLRTPSHPFLSPWKSLSLPHCPPFLGMCSGWGVTLTWHFTITRISSLSPILQMEKLSRRPTQGHPGSEQQCSQLSPRRDLSEALSSLAWFGREWPC